jgi:hypothetical protein
MTAASDDHAANAARQRGKAGDMAAFLNNVEDVQDTARLAEMVGLLKQELDAQFKFEREHLFAIFEEIGRTEIVDILKQDHTVIAPLVDRLADLAAPGKSDAFSPAQWSEFRRTVLHVANLLSARAAKEEHMLIPALDEAIAATDPD